MAIRKLLATITFLFFSSLNATAFAENFYVEAGISQYAFDDVTTQSYSDTVSGITFTNARLSLDYSSSSTFDFEVGGYLSKNLRLGLSISNPDLDFSSATLSGTISDGSTTLDASTTVTRADLTSIDADLELQTQLTMVNLYLDLEKTGSLVPFFGLGFGIANIKWDGGTSGNKDALSFSSGFKYEFGENYYVCLKGSYFSLQGSVSDGLGITYDDIAGTSANLSFGYKF